MGLGFVEREEVEEWLPFCKTQQMPTAGGQVEGLEMKDVASGWAHGGCAGTDVPLADLAGIGTLGAPWAQSC